MGYRTRIKYTASQKADIWDRWQHVESLNSIGRLSDRPSSSIFNSIMIRSRHYRFKHGRIYGVGPASRDGAWNYRT